MPRVLWLTPLLALLLNGCLDRGSSSGADSRSPTLGVALIPFGSDSELEGYLKEGLRQQYQGGGDYRYAVEALEDVAAVADGGTTTSVSGTNLQEVGVDEADRIKSDGDYLYLLDSGTTGYDYPLFATAASTGGPALRVLRLGAMPPSATEVASLAWPSDQGSPSGLYLLGDALNVVSEEQGGYPGIWYRSDTWRGGRVWLKQVDVSTPNAPRISRTLSFDGHLVGSRRVGDRLYLALRHSPTVNVAYPYSDADLDRTLATLSLGDLLPDWYLNGTSQGDLIAPSQCQRIPSDARDRSPDLLTVVVLDLADSASTPEAHCLTGRSEALYMSSEALYLASTRYHYTTWSDSDSLVRARYESYVQTDLHKFSLADASVGYRGSIALDGHLGWEQDKKSFRMGEYQGVLRVALSVGNDWDASASTRLYTLAEGDDGLELLAQLPNARHPERIGLPGERLYAARFLGERGYLVTFRLTDPLYVLDLSDPRDPFVAGELKLTGYSDYLHPVSANLVLGIGKEAIADSRAGDGRGAWYQGLKLSLFDVADPAAPKLADSLVIGQRGSDSDLLRDHHALAWLPPDPTNATPGRLALPVRLHDGSCDTRDPWCYYPWQHTGLYLFEIDSGTLGTGPAAIHQQGEMLVEQSDGSQTYSWGDGNDRALIAGEGVHYIHNGKVWSGEWSGARITGSSQ